jgi:hypothetical protein
MILQKPYVMLTKTKTTSTCPIHSGSDLSVSSSSLLATEDWSGKVVPYPGGAPARRGAEEEFVASAYEGGG